MRDAADRRSNRSDSVAPISSIRGVGRGRILVIDDADDTRDRTVALLSDAGFSPFAQPSAIGATRMLVNLSIPAVVVDLGMPGLSGEKLIAVLRKNRRLDGLVIVVITSMDCPRQAMQQGLREADAVVIREHLDSRLVPTLERLLCVSGFHQKAPNLAALLSSSGDG